MLLTKKRGGGGEGEGNKCKENLGVKLEKGNLKKQCGGS